MSSLAIDGITLPAPSSLAVQQTPIATTTRMLDGSLASDVVAIKRTVTIQWARLAAGWAETLEGLLAPTTTHTVAWVEPTGPVTLTMIVSRRSRGLQVGRSVWDPIAGRWDWADVQLTLEEV